MRMHRDFYLALALLASTVACREESERSGAGASATQQGAAGGEVVASTTPTASELAQFAPLPATMKAPGVTPTAAQIDLGRRLYHETVLSNGHDVSCNTCHPLNGYGADGRRVSFGSLGHA